jgi:hypothetical protein
MNVLTSAPLLRYGEIDKKHIEYFKYLTEGNDGEFKPNSDMTFSEFKSAIKKEWESLASTRLP